MTYKIFNHDTNDFIKLVEAFGNDGTSLIADVTPIEWNKVVNVNRENSWSGDTFAVRRTSFFYISGLMRANFSGVYLKLYVDNVATNVISTSSYAVRPFFFFGVLEKGSMIQVRTTVNITLINSTIEHFIKIFEVKK